MEFSGRVPPCANLNSIDLAPISKLFVGLVGGMGPVPLRKEKKKRRVLFEQDSIRKKATSLKETLFRNRKNDRAVHLLVSGSIIKYTPQSDVIRPPKNRNLLGLLFLNL